MFHQSGASEMWIVLARITYADKYSMVGATLLSKNTLYEDIELRERLPVDVGDQLALGYRKEKATGQNHIIGNIVSCLWLTKKLKIRSSRK